jgi:hypothetical protein
MHRFICANTKLSALWRCCAKKNANHFVAGELSVTNCKICVGRLKKTKEATENPATSFKSIIVKQL